MNPKLISSSAVAVASVMNTKFLVTAASMNSILSCKLFLIRPFHFHFRNFFSTKAHSQTLFSQFASTKLNLSEADITRIFKSRPQLQNLRTLHNAELVIHSLKKHGCTEVQVSNIVRTNPQVIGFAARTFEPKMKVLEDFGFVDQKLAKLLMINPTVLGLSLKSNLLPKMEFLKNVFQSEDVLVKALLRAPLLLGSNLEKMLKPSVAFWEGWGFSGTGLLTFLQPYPAALSRTSLTPAQVRLIHEISADKTGKMFKYIVGIVAVSRLETLEAKIENLKLCGLSAEEVWQLIRAYPLVFSLSKENVREKMNFLVNNMELRANYVLKHYNVLKLNLEKTMRPRFLVWQKMKSINDLKLSLLTVLMMPEASFVSKIIEGHPESKTLWSIYESALSNASNRANGSAKPNFWMARLGSEIKNHNKLLYSLAE